MTSADTGPLIPRRRLGAAFRELREARGETLQQTAKAVMFSPSKLSRLENGGAGEPHPRDVRDLIAHFDLTRSSEADRLEKLAAAGRVPGWWQVPPYQFTGQLDTFISYESAAARIQEYSPVLVPGILQTPEYAREVFRTFLPEATTDEVELLTQGRLARHQALRQLPAPPERLYVVPETILHRRTGTAKIMEGQLAALVEAFDEPHITLHLIPFSAGLYEAVSLTTTTVFQFDSTEDDDVVAIERIRHTEFFERPRTVEKYREILDRLPDLYLSATDSRKFIERELMNWRRKK